MSQRALTGAGVAVAAAAGYYLYSAGGDPAVAEKKAEYDASRLVGGSKQAGKGASVSATEVGSKIDSGLQQAKATGQQYSTQLQQYGRDTEKSLEQSYAQAKSQANQTAEQIKASTEQYQKQAVTQYEQAKAQAQAQVEQARARGGEYQKQAESYLADAEKRLEQAKSQAMSAVDTFDRTVEAKAAQAKGGILSWFGGK